MAANKEGITIYFEGDTVQFDKSVDGIEKALKVLKSQTKALNKQFLDSKSLTDLNKKIRSLRQEYSLSIRAAKDWSNEWKTLKARYDELYGRKRTKEEEKEFKSVDKAMTNAMNHYESSIDRTIKLRNELKKCYDIANQMAQKPNELQQNLANIGNTMETIGDKTKKLSDYMQKFLKNSVDQAVKFEDAFAEVKKTVDETDTTKYEDIAKSLRDLSQDVPTTADELAKIAGLAGQMGVNADDIVNFTKAMVDFGNATNITAEDAAQEIAQIYNVIGKGGDFSTLNNLLSTIVDLGNNSATTEKDIVEMFRNISAASSRVGMSEQQMAALAATLSSLGLDKGGASSISTIMTKIDMAVSTNSKELQEWADAAGMSVDKFTEAWGIDAAGALASLLENLKQTVDAGGNLNQEFEDLGIKEMRRVDTLGRLVNAQNVYADALQRAESSFREGNALSEEANKRYQTLASKMQILKNRFSEFQRTIGDTLAPVITFIVDKAGELLNIINALPGGVTTLITLVTTFMAVISPLTSVLGKILGNNVALTNSLKDFIKFMTSTKGILLGVASAFLLLYTQNEDFRNAVNKTASAIWEHLKPVLSDLWAVFQQLWNIIGWVVDKINILWELFKQSSVGQFFIGMIEAIIETVKIAIDIIDGLIGAVKTIFGWFEKLLGIETEVSTNMPRSVSVLESGGFNGFASGGFTVNNSFTINGTEQLSNSRLIEVADIITDRVNENLGRMV